MCQCDLYPWTMHSKHQGVKAQGVWWATGGGYWLLASAFIMVDHQLVAATTHWPLESHDEIKATSDTAVWPHFTPHVNRSSQPLPMEKRLLTAVIRSTSSWTHAISPAFLRQTARFMGWEWSHTAGRLEWPSNTRASLPGTSL